MSNKLTKQDKKELQKQRDEILENPLIQGEGIHVCSDGTELSFRQNSRHIKLKMMHLEESEINGVLSKSVEFFRVRGRLMQIDRKLDGGAAFKKNRDWEEALKRSEEILDLFGKFYSGTEVHKIITTEWKYRTVKYDWVLKFQRENVEMIEQLRDEYQKNVSNVRLVHKRSRLDELSGLYQSRKAKYEQSESREDYKLLLITIEQIRKEIEGQRLTIDGHIQVEHEHRIQEHVNTEILKHLNINDLIVSRLCARLKMSPKYLLYRLHQSYYKKFTGFLPKQTETESVPIYPSSIVYDFDNIHDKMEALELKDAEHLEEAVIVDTGTSVALRDLVTKKLAEKRESLDKQRRVIKVVEGPEPTAKRKITTKRAKGKNKTKNKK